MSIRDGRFGARRRARIPAALIAVVLAALAAFMLLDSARSSGDPPFAVSVTVDAAHPGRAVPGRFLGLSFEMSSLAEVDALGAHGDLIGLLRSLGPGLLRFGGVSADSRTAWTDRRTARPSWASGVVDAAQLRALAALTKLSGWRVLLTLGMAHYDPRAAAREAAAAQHALGSQLAAIEIGNEPDAYAEHHLRTQPWTYRRYDAEVRRYRRAIARRAPRLALAGPGVSGSHAFARWGVAEVHRLRPALLTGHHYPLGCRDTPPPSVERLLSPDVRALENASLARYVSVSQRARIGLRIDEANTVSCGGVHGVSDTFASALWAVNYIARTMAAGVSGINLQGNPERCSGYSPLCATSPAQLAAGALSAQPEWYALLLTRALVGYRAVATTIASPQPANLVVLAFLGPQRTLRLAVVDDEPPGSDPAALSIEVGRRYRAAKELALTAPAPDATGGVQLGGAVVAADGSWTPASEPQLPLGEGKLSVTVAPSSAALITVTPQP